MSKILDKYKQRKKEILANTEINTNEKRNMLFNIWIDYLAKSVKKASKKAKYKQTI